MGEYHGRWYSKEPNGKVFNVKIKKCRNPILSNKMQSDWHDKDGTQALLFLLWTPSTFLQLPGYLLLLCAAMMYYLQFLESIKAYYTVRPLHMPSICQEQSLSLPLRLNEVNPSHFSKSSITVMCYDTHHSHQAELVTASSVLPLYLICVNNIIYHIVIISNTSSARSSCVP